MSDCPFILIDSYYVVIPSAARFIDPSRAIMSNLNRKNINISIKGNKFENTVRETVNNAGLNCINLYEQVSPEEKYECDLVFNIDSNIFFIEVKHLNYPMNYREYQRSLDEIEQACNQLTRIANYFSGNSIRLKNKLGIENMHKIYKIVVTNMSQGEVISYNGCLVTDDTHFTGYFKRRPPAIHEIHNKVVVSKELFTEFYEGPINTDQFINLIKNSPLIETCRKRISYELYDYTKELGIKLINYSSKIDTIVVKDFLTDSEKMQLSKLYHF